jgi:hypothetical protein
MNDTLRSTQHYDTKGTFGLGYQTNIALPGRASSQRSGPPNSEVGFSRCRYYDYRLSSEARKTNDSTRT